MQSVDTVSRARALVVPVALRPWVRALWHRRTVAGETVRTLPDSSLDLKLVVGPPARLYFCGVGAEARVQTVERAFELYGITLHPGVARLLGPAAHELPSGWLAADEIWPELRTLLARPRPGMELLEAVLGFLVARSERTRRDWRVGRALDAVAGARGPIDVRGLARAVALSERSLGRLFDEHVGVAPKTHLRIMRMQRAIAALREGRAALSDIAVAAGFADQAHMTRELVELTGVTPRRWRSA